MDCTSGQCDGSKLIASRRMANEWITGYHLSPLKLYLQMLVLRNILCNTFLVLHLSCTVLRATEFAPCLPTFFYGPVDGFFFLICLLILICHISDDTLRITTLGFFYSQLTDETAAHRVICCLLYHFFSNAIIARAVHCFHNSIPVTAALEEYASSHQGPSSSVAQAHWGGPQNGLEGQ